MNYDPEKGQNALYYQLILKESDLENDSEIAVFARPLDYRSDPDIYISTTDKHPSTENSEIK